MAQARWRCSTAQSKSGAPLYEPYESLGDLDPECRGVVDEVAALTGAEPCADCPLAQTRSEHNPWIGIVTRAYRDREKSSLALRHPNPAAVLIDALDVLTDAVDARQQHERENRPKPQHSPNQFVSREEPEDE